MSNANLIEKYPWAQNISKLCQAIALCGGQSAPEEKIKAKYIELKGLIVKNHKPSAPLNTDSSQKVVNNSVTGSAPKTKEEESTPLEDLSMKDLRAAGKSAGIEDYDTLKKDELIKALNDVA